jgi:hypothetical protein
MAGRDLILHQSITLFPSPVNQACSFCNDLVTNVMKKGKNLSLVFKRDKKRKTWDKEI